VNCYAALDPAIGFGGTKMSGRGYKGTKEDAERYLYHEAIVAYRALERSVGLHP
jgi:aldehyde dehydrogenase (NAD+)